jgi:hypothetical protein
MFLHQKLNKIFAESLIKFNALIEKLDSNMDLNSAVMPAKIDSKFVIEKK